MEAEALTATLAPPSNTSINPTRNSAALKFDVPGGRVISALGARLFVENWITLNSIMRVVNHANLSPEQIAQLESELSGQQNLKDVMKWAFSHPKGVFILTVVANVIVQDEFTHDVIVPYRDDLVLVYDTT